MGNTTKLNTFTDFSGQITVSVFTNKPTSPDSVFHNWEVDVDEDMVCIGGGATGAEFPNGALLTASYPNIDTKGNWSISTKSHEPRDPHFVTAYAIGMKIDGINVQDLKDNVVFRRKHTIRHPNATATLPEGYSLLGGGFKTLYPGNLATASFPESSISWKAHYDRNIPGRSILSAYAIGIKTKLTTKDTNGNEVPTGQTITTSFQSSSSLAKPHPVSVANVIPGYALCGGGAEVHYNVGNYLWSLEPSPTLHKITDPLVDQSFTGKSKDHVEMRDPSIITTYAMGIKMMV